MRRQRSSATLLVDKDEEDQFLTEATLRLKAKAAAKAHAEQYLVDPALFARQLLGHDLWEMQQRILRSVAEERLVAVKACHSSGKTYLAADAVLWWVKRYPDGIVVSTAPTDTQVKELLWGEIRKTASAHPELFPSPNLKALRISEGNYALGLSTNESVRFQGFHGRHVLIVLDEAPGVRPEIWEAIEGIRAGGDVHVLAIGNPTVTSGPFFDAFHRDRHLWRTYTISALDTPNLGGLSLEDVRTLPEDALGHNPYPYLASRRWVQEKLLKWGADSDLFRARVLGEFPQQGVDSLIPLAWVEAADTRELPEGGLLEAGLDVARFGDDSTALCLRQGDNVVDEWEWQDFDTMRTCGQVSRELAPYHSQLAALKVDVIGVGSGVADRLAEQGWPVVDVNVAEAPSFSSDRGAAKFLNRRSEYWWGLRERFRAGLIAGPLHEDTQAELVSVRYTIDSAGRVVIEKKEDARKRGIPSPNRADALMLAFAPCGPANGRNGSSGPVRRAIRVS